MENNERLKPGETVYIDMTPPSARYWKGWHSYHGVKVIIMKEIEGLKLPHCTQFPPTYIVRRPSQKRQLRGQWSIHILSRTKPKPILE